MRSKCSYVLVSFAGRVNAIDLTSPWGTFLKVEDGLVCCQVVLRRIREADAGGYYLVTCPDSHPGCELLVALLQQLMMMMMIMIMIKVMMMMVMIMIMKMRLMVIY